MLKYQRDIVNKNLTKDLVAEDDKMHKLIYEPPTNNGFDNEIRFCEAGKFEVNCWRKIIKDEIIIKSESIFYDVDSDKLRNRLSLRVMLEQQQKRA